MWWWSSRSEHEAINMGAREVACEHIGQEAVLQVLQKVQVPPHKIIAKEEIHTGMGQGAQPRRVLQTWVSRNYCD